MALGLARYLIHAAPVSGSLHCPRPALACRSRCRRSGPPRCLIPNCASARSAASKSLDQLDRGPWGEPQLGRILLECLARGGECLLVPAETVTHNRSGRALEA